jgi:hypothetical protein
LASDGKRGREGSYFVEPAFSLSFFFFLVEEVSEPLSEEEESLLVPEESDDPFRA